MAFDKVEDFNKENHDQYIDFLNKEFGIGISKKEYTLFLEAMTAPAFAKKYNESKMIKDPKDKIRDYNINEFKGDAIITYIVITEILQDEDVCFMDDKKQKLISNKNFSKIFDDLKLERFMYVDNINNISDKIKADMFESLAFAIHEKSKSHLIKFLIKSLDVEDIKKSLTNH